MARRLDTLGRQSRDLFQIGRLISYSQHRIAAIAETAQELHPPSGL